MRKRKNAYELSRSQVDTPEDVVSLFWQVAHKYRHRFSSVLDLGAGDGRFALGGGRFGEYVGVEIDKRRKQKTNLPPEASITYGCAFRHGETGYAACIGNPPYVRHHDLDPSWRDRIANSISTATGQTVNRKCNLYIYFLFLALLRSRSQGLVATIVPYEWVSRPAALPLRNYIQSNGWQVDTYRFSEPIFSSVETTAAISIIDKRNRSGKWNFFSISRQGVIAELPKVTGSKQGLIAYADRGDIWAQRGMSPGTQKVFTLSNGERIHAGLTMRDVYPCVTTLRDVPKELTNLTRPAFQSRFVEAGAKCWLIRSDRDRMSDRLSDYLDAVPKQLRSTSTCTNRTPWHRYPLFDQPDMLVSSGFIGRAPKALINSIGAHAVGAVHGVYDVPSGAGRELQNYIASSDFSSRVVAHSGNLRKLEIRQLNSILNTFSQKRRAAR